VGLVVHVVHVVLVVHSVKAGFVIHVVQAVFVGHLTQAGFIVFEQLNPPWLNVPLKQHELHE
jgi:hypothetical protein